MTICSDVSQRGTQLLTRSNAVKYALGWMGLADYAQSLTIPSNLPKPEFTIGDKVTNHWLDEFDVECIEYGTICGIVWHPREQVWAYLIDWYKGQGPDFLYPCFDGHLVIGGDLRSAGDD